jgi:hypothetical protein
MVANGPGLSYRDDPHMGLRHDEIAGRILERLYELRDQDAIPDLLAEARSAGVSSTRGAVRAIESLNMLGLLKEFMVGRGPTYHGRLGTVGVRLYERFGGGRALLSRLAAAEVVGGETHYHGPVFLGDVGHSNVAFSGEGVAQSVALAPPTRALIEELIEVIRDDPALAASPREEAVGDVRTVQSELEKSRPNWKVVGYLLTGLGAIASAAAQVKKLREALGLP